MKKLLLLLLIPGIVLAKEKPNVLVKQPEKSCAQPQNPKLLVQKLWKEKMDACTTPKEKQYLAEHKTVPIEYTLDPAKATLASAIYEEHRKIYLRIRPCLDKQAPK